MYCPKCGNEQLPDAGSLCTICGTAVTEQQPTLANRPYSHALRGAIGGAVGGLCGGAIAFCMAHIEQAAAAGETWIYPVLFALVSGFVGAVGGVVFVRQLRGRPRGPLR